MGQLNIGRSIDIAWEMDERIAPSECWANSVKVLRTASLKLGQAKYVEGWAVVTIAGQSLTIEHGWIELEDGSVADPTSIVNRGDDEELNMEMEHSIEYFPGVRYTLQELKGVRLRSLPHVWRTGGWGGFRNQHYKSAYEQARRRAGYDE